MNTLLGDRSDTCDRVCLWEIISERGGVVCCYLKDNRVWNTPPNSLTREDTEGVTFVTSVTEPGGEIQ